jgi:hypothetical protein
VHDRLLATGISYGGLVVCSIVHCALRNFRQRDGRPARRLFLGEVDR